MVIILHDKAHLKKVQ